MGILDTIKNKSIQATIVTTADWIVRYMQKDPQKNIDKALKRLSALDIFHGDDGPLQSFMAWTQQNPGAKQWFANLLSRNPRQARVFVRNFIGNCAIKWMQTADSFADEYGFVPPYNILISPTMRCNLHCRGCYAAEYSQKKDDDMSVETFDRIIAEGKQIGVYFYTILGGEPFVKFDDIYAMAKKHNDCLFQVFTNGTLITDEVADRIEDAANIIVAFSVNGTREDTDFMRGEGAYDKVLESVAKMRQRNLLFGMSLVLTSKNFETLVSRDFLKFWENQGVVYGWNFLFMPVGPQPDLSLMPTAEQRVEFGEFIKRYREQEPLFIMDFWADAPALSGCIAGGRRYLHINSKGDVEPCIFAHHATHNIHNCSLIEALQSPFFTYIRMSQPHTDNYLRPCMIIDNPEVWRSACTRFGARPTEPGAEELISNQQIKDGIDRYSASVAKIADKLWLEQYQHKINSMRSQKKAYGEGIDRIEFQLNRPRFLEQMQKWAEKNPNFVRSMLESLEYINKNYGTDKERHIQLAEEKPEKTPVDSAGTSKDIPSNAAV